MNASEDLCSLEHRKSHGLRSEAPPAYLGSPCTNASLDAIWKDGHATTDGLRRRPRPLLVLRLLLAFLVRASAWSNDLKKVSQLASSLKIRPFMPIFKATRCRDLSRGDRGLARSRKVRRRAETPASLAGIIVNGVNKALGVQRKFRFWHHLRQEISEDYSHIRWGIRGVLRPEHEDNTSSC